MLDDFCSVKSLASLSSVCKDVLISTKVIPRGRFDLLLSSLCHSQSCRVMYSLGVAGPKNPLFVSSRTSCSRQKTSCPELMDKRKTVISAVFVNF